MCILVRIYAHEKQAVTDNVDSRIIVVGSLGCCRERKAAGFEHQCVHRGAEKDCP